VLRREIEFDLDFLCVTGVEDKLQEHVAETLTKMRLADI